eukprot:8170154-Karenia_brevis.AAC.1
MREAGSAARDILLDNDGATYARNQLLTTMGRMVIQNHTALWHRLSNIHNLVKQHVGIHQGHPFLHDPVLFDRNVADVRRKVLGNQEKEV